MRGYIPGEGTACRLFICAERPGWDDLRNRRPFSGPPGQEFFARLKQVTGLERSDCYVTHLHKLAGDDPISERMAADDTHELLAELRRWRPAIIVALGTPAIRWFLQSGTVSADDVHGLVHRAPADRGGAWGAYVVPLAHVATALHQPSRYQPQLTHDLEVVDRVLRGKARVHDEHPPVAHQRGLAGLLGDVPPGVVGLDTEGELYRPWTVECISLSGEPDAGSVVETFERGATTPALPHIQTVLDRCERLAIHHAKHDVKGLLQLGLRVDWSKVDDTMVMAYLLNFPQGLKELMRRRHEWQMKEYTDLVLPLDDRIVRDTLASAYTLYTTRWEQHETARKLSKKNRKLRLKGKSAEVVWVPGEPELPKRALTSIRKMLDTPTDDTLRKRWSGSTFAPHLELPPQRTWKHLPPAVRTEYALVDALAHRELRDDLWRLVRRRGLDRVYAIDMAVVPLLARNEMVGLQCNRKKLERISLEFKEQYAEACVEINELAGFPVNPRSGEQVADCLFEELGITPTRKTKGGQHTTADKYLKARRHEHRIIQRILDARQLGKYTSTYTDKLPLLLERDADGAWRYFPDWKYTRTDTGRLAEAIILLIPKHDPLAKAQGRRNRAKLIRNAFHAGPGRSLVSVDLSQIELRVMAELSQDEQLLGVYRRGEDLHTKVAHELLGAPKDKKDQDDSAHRLPAKTVNFGINNGMTEFGMLDQLHEAGQLQWTIEKVRALLDGWWKIHHGVERYWDKQIDHALEHGWIEEPLFGRRREVHGVWSVDDRVYAEAKRQCLFGIQSAADTISKVWNAIIDREILQPRRAKGEYAEFWVRVHDDTTLEVETHAAEQVKAEMLGLVPQLLSIPTLAEGKIADRWGDL